MPLLWPSTRSARSAVAVVKSTVWPASTTARPRAIEVRLADAGRPEEERILGAGDEAAGGQLAHELGVDGGLKLEVEVLQGFHRREVRDLDPHLDPAALLGGHLIAQQLVEEVDVRRLHPRRFAQRRIEAIGERAEAQPLEMIDDTGVDELVTHPPASATATA